MNIMIKANKITLRLTIGIFILVLFTCHSYSYVFANRLFESFENSAEKSSTIDSYIVTGAENYLKGYSDYLLVLNRVEIATDPATLDFQMVQTLLNRTIETMEKAKANYESLKQTADNTPYNPIVIDKMLTFDYTSFCREKGLNKIVFDEVRQYFEKGDARGVFNCILADTGEILNILNTLKATVDANQFPVLSDLWRLNQHFSETLLFGQYAAQLMYAICD